MAGVAHAAAAALLVTVAVGIVSNLLFLGADKAAVAVAFRVWLTRLLWRPRPPFDSPDDNPYDPTRWVAEIRVGRATTAVTAS